MTTDDPAVQFPRMAPTPNPALRRLERLVGAWDVSGENIRGRVVFAWMEGGFFLTQTIDLVHDARSITGVEYIGYDPETRSLTSHYFGNQEIPFRYTWEVADDTLTIWYGQAGSAAHFSGTFSADGTSNTGRWTWPGGGYGSKMTRVG